MYLCEGQKWDLEHEVRKRDWEVLPKNKIKQKYRIQNIYKTTLILFDKIMKKNTNKLFVTHFFLFHFNTAKNRVFENHEKVKKSKMQLITNNSELIFIFFTQSTLLLRSKLEASDKGFKLFHRLNVN